MTFSVRSTDVRAVGRGFEDDLAHIQTAAVRDWTADTQDRWRKQIIAAGLGKRLSRTIRSKVYPQSGVSLDPAGMIWTRAPQIIDGHSENRVLRPSGERAADSFSGRVMFALPTLHTPKVGGRRLTPEEVENRYNQDLILKRGRRGHWLAFIDINYGRWAQRSRLDALGRHVLSPRDAHKPKPTKQRLIHVFTFVPDVRMRRRLDLDAIAVIAEARFPVLLSKHWR